MPQKVPGMESLECLQKDMEEITENPMIKSLVSTGHGNLLDSISIKSPMGGQSPEAIPLTEANWAQKDTF